MFGFVFLVWRVVSFILPNVVFLGRFCEVVSGGCGRVF